MYTIAIRVYCDLIEYKDINNLIKINYMIPKLSILKCILITFTILYSGNSFCGVKYYQSNKVKKDGSIIINITYSSKDSDLKDNMSGELPFTEEAVKQYFSSPNSEIKKCLVYKDPSDKSISGVTLEIDARDINKLSTIKGFENFKTNWLKGESGMTFNWLVPVSFVKDNSIDTYQFVLTFEDKIISTNGVLKDSTCNWYVFADKMNPGGAFFVAAVSSGENSNKTTSPTETSVKTGGDKKSEDVDLQGGKPKSCGLFSIELPFILFCGLIISYRARREREV